MKRPAIVEIIWTDAHFDSAASTETPEYDPVVRYSVGYDIGAQKGAWGIAQSVDDAGADNALMYQDMVWIPVGTIKSRKVVRRAVL